MLLSSAARVHSYERCACACGRAERMREPEPSSTDPQPLESFQDCSFLSELVNPEVLLEVTCGSENCRELSEGTAGGLT